MVDTLHPNAAVSLITVNLLLSSLLTLFPAPMPAFEYLPSVNTVHLYAVVYLTVPLFAPDPIPASEK